MSIACLLSKPMMMLTCKEELVYLSSRAGHGWGLRFGGTTSFQIPVLLHRQLQTLLQHIMHKMNSTDRTSGELSLHISTKKTHLSSPHTDRVQLSLQRTLTENFSADGPPSRDSFSKREKPVYMRRTRAREWRGGLILWK